MSNETTDRPAMPMPIDIPTPEQRDKLARKAIADLQRAMHETNGYAPPRECDWIDPAPDTLPPPGTFVVVPDSEFINWGNVWRGVTWANDPNRITTSLTRTVISRSRATPMPPVVVGFKMIGKSDPPREIPPSFWQLVKGWAGRPQPRRWAHVFMYRPINVSEWSTGPDWLLQPDIKQGQPPTFNPPCAIAEQAGWACVLPNGHEGLCKNTIGLMPTRDLKEMFDHSYRYSTATIDAVRAELHERSIYQPPSEDGLDDDQKELLRINSVPPSMAAPTREQTIRTMPTHTLQDIARGPGGWSTFNSSFDIRTAINELEMRGVITETPEEFNHRMTFDGGTPDEPDGGVR